VRELPGVAKEAAEEVRFVVALAVAGAKAHLIFKLVYGTTKVVP
jgi:hypothetical protein